MATYGGSRWIGLFQYALVAPFQALYRVLLYIVGYNGAASQLDETTESNTPTAVQSKTRKSRGNSEHHRDHVRNVRINLLNGVRLFSFKRCLS